MAAELVLLSNKLVDEVFEKFLAAADIGGRFALLEHVGFQIFEAGLARFNLRADAGIPLPVTLFNKICQAFVFANRRCDLQSAHTKTLLPGETIGVFATMSKPAKGPALKLFVI
jgi:hypothetical protein